MYVEFDFLRIESGWLLFEKEYVRSERTLSFSSFLKHFRQFSYKYYPEVTAEFRVPPTLRANFKNEK